MKILKAAEAFDKSAKIYQEKFMDVNLYAEFAELHAWYNFYDKDQT